MESLGVGGNLPNFCWGPASFVFFTVGRANLGASALSPSFEARFLGLCVLYFVLSMYTCSIVQAKSLV